MKVRDFWVTDLVNIVKAHNGMTSYDEVYQRYLDPFSLFPASMSQEEREKIGKYIAATSFIHSLAQCAIKQDRHVAQYLIQRGKTDKSDFVERYKQVINFLVKQVEGQGITKQDIEFVAKERRDAVVKGLTTGDLESRVQAFSDAFIESRYQEAQESLRKRNLPLCSDVDFKTQSYTFDELGQEVVVTKYDVFMWPTQNEILKKIRDNQRRIIEIKISDPKLYDSLGVSQLSGRHPLEPKKITQRTYDLLQVSLQNVMEHSRYRDFELPRITAELQVFTVGERPQRAEVGAEKALQVGRKALKDLIELRHVGPDEFRKRRGIK